MKRIIVLSALLVLILSGCTSSDENPATRSSSKKPNHLNYKNTFPVHFTTHKTDTSVQISQYIRRILQDSKGNIWFGTTSDGVCMYNGNTLYFAKDKSVSDKTVMAMLEDKNGNIWLGTNDGLFKYDQKSFIRYTTKEGLPDNNVWSVLEGKDGTIWVGTLQGVCCYSPSTPLRTGSKTFTSFILPQANIKNAVPKYSNKLVLCMLQDTTGNIWFGTDGFGVTKYDGKSFTHLTKKEGLCCNTVTSILQDKKGNIWFGTVEWNRSEEGGVSCYNGTSFTTYNKKKGLSGNHILSMHEQKNGTLWFVVRGNGADKFDGVTFTNLNKKDGLTNLAVQSILEDNNGKIWIGSGAGLFRYDGTTVINVTKNGPWK